MTNESKTLRQPPSIDAGVMKGGVKPSQPTMNRGERNTKAAWLQGEDARADKKGAARERRGGDLSL
jgi:hypothetical protein